MLMKSGLYPQLEIYYHDGKGSPLAIYGDPVYPHRVHLQIPYKGEGLTDAQNNGEASPRFGHANAKFLVFTDRIKINF